MEQEIFSSADRTRSALTMEDNKLQKTDGAKREVERSLGRMDMGEEDQMSWQADMMNREGNEGYAEYEAQESSSSGQLVKILVSRETEMTFMTRFLEAPLVLSYRRNKAC